MLTAGAPASRGHEEDRMLRAVRLIVDRAGRLPLRVGVNRGMGGAKTVAALEGSAACPPGFFLFL